MSRALEAAVQLSPRMRAAVAAAVVALVAAPAAFADDLRELVRTTAAGAGPYGAASALVPAANCLDLLGHAPAVPGPESSGPPAHAVSAEETAAGPAQAKTDGRLLVSLHRGRLRVFDVGGPTPTARGAVDLGPLVPSGLFLHGRRALVVGEMEPDTVPGTARRTVGLTVVDLTDTRTPRVLATQAVSGRPLVARLARGVVRVVVASPPHLPLPARRALDATGAGGPVRPLAGCGDVLRPTDGTGADLLTVLSVDLEGSGTAAPPAMTVLADADTAYLTADRLFVATSRGGASVVHGFDTQERALTPYVGSGRLDGRIPGAWAMSEHVGVLRVLSQRVVGNRTRTDLVTMRPGGPGLVEVGRLADAARGEQVQTLRWFGESAAVVTVRELDTMRMLDLSDPERPARRGAMAVPWCDDHLRPIGDFRLLAVGPAAAGGPGRLQLSSYDVIDPDEPRLTGDVRYGGPHSSSAAETDPSLLVYVPEAGTAVLPATWRLGESAACTHGRCPADIDRDRFNGLVAVRVGEEGRLTQVARWRSRGAAAGAWSTDAPALVAVALPGGRVAALDGRGLTVLDAEDLTVRGFVAHPQP